MKKRILYVCSVCFCMASTAYSQETTTTIQHEVPQVVLQNISLHKLSDQIAAKEASLVQLSNSSRGQLVTATDELNGLRRQYKDLLTSEMAITTDETALKQLRSELRYVESKLAVKSTR